MQLRFAHWSLYIALGAAAVACARAEAAPSREDGSPAVRVTTATVTERKLPKSALLTGSLEAHASSDVAAEGAGKVIFAKVERGDQVKKGTILARLDASEAALAAAEAGAAADAARTQETHARLECERSKRLAEQNVISRAEWDRVRAGCDTATSSRSAAQARAARARRQVADSVVRAPFDGVVVERFVDVGEFVAPGTRIARIVQSDPIRVQLSLPETLVGQVHTGQKIDFSVAILPDEEFSATVRYISPALEERDRSLTLEAVLNGTDARLKPGMFVTAKVAVGAEQSLAVPRSALVTDGATPRLFVVREKQLEVRVVSIGQRDGEWVAVNKGIAGGESVVVQPAADLRDGMRVE